MKQLKKRELEAERVEPREAKRRHEEEELQERVKAAEEEEEKNQVEGENMASNEELMNKIASLRDGREYGDKSVHPFSAPKLNWSATSIRNIKDWSDITELLIMTLISMQKLMQFPSHTQSCE